MFFEENLYHLMNLDTIIQRYILSPPFASLSLSLQWVYILEIMSLSFLCV